MTKAVKDVKYHKNGPDSGVPPLLGQFIYELLKKEKKAGLSKLRLRKFHVACLMLAYTPGLRLRQIALLAKVPNERLVRNWRTEDKFKARVDKLITIYADEFVSNLETSDVLLDRFYYLLTDEFCRYSKELRVAIADLLSVAVKNPFRTLAGDSVQDMKNRCLFSFAVLAMHYKQAAPHTKEQRLNFAETQHKQSQIYHSGLPIIFREAMETNNFELAKQMFEITFSRVEELEEALYYFQKEDIEHGRRKG